jgi:hypothetical protein
MAERPSPIDAILGDPENEKYFIDEKPVVRASTEENRIISGFEEINAFVKANGFAPGDSSNGRETDFMEDSLAARLDALKSNQQYRELLAPLDLHGLLGGEPLAPLPTTMDEILALDDPIFDASHADEIFTIEHIPAVTSERSPYDATSRVRAEDFEQFEHIFRRLKEGLAAGTLVAKREISPEKRRGTKTTVLGVTDIQPGTAFILNGIIAYVLSRDDGVIRTVNQVRDAHLHLVFENGTEAKRYLLRSFARVLFEDEKGSQIVDAKTGLPVNVNAAHADLPIFGGHLVLGDEDTVTGQIYIARSLSSDKQITELAGRLFKIGFTTQKVETRIATAATDPTFLYSPVELVASYTIANTRPSAVEKTIHTFFGPARLKIILSLGRPVQATEWFVVPLDQIKAAIPKIQDRTIANYLYDPLSQKIIPR